MWLNANGLDTSPVLNIKSKPLIKSISNSVTLPHDIIDENEVRAVLLALSEKVSYRMRKAELLCNTVQLYIRDFEFCSYERQVRLEIPNRTASCLLEASFNLFKINHISGKPIRAIGIRACNLSSDSECQMDISERSSVIDKRERAESTTDAIRNKYGRKAIQRGIILNCDILSSAKINDENLSFTKTMDM
ncbi:MAG: DNA polymerase IV, partial [Clostridia bacterium]|nr:DNA polymerase IV [Clostridia bacterium]